MADPHFLKGWLRMALQLTHHLDDAVVVRYGDCELFTYVYKSQVAATESPKPYLHPLRTLGGHPVTGFRPHDHRWHTGLAMTFAEVSGTNFWGGNTYVHGEGYRLLPNLGVQRHIAWETMDAQEQTATLAHRLDWVNHDGSRWLTESRSWRIAVRADLGYWALRYTCTLENVSDTTLEFGSPTTQGRPKAGYGSLFWRGPRAFAGAPVLAAGGMTGDEAIMGERSPWLAVVGTHDEVDARSTLLFVDNPANPRYPTQWFVRSRPYACVSFALTFDEVYALPPNERLGLTYHLALADAAWSPQDCERVARELVH